MLDSMPKYFPYGDGKYGERLSRLPEKLLAMLVRFPVIGTIKSAWANVRKHVSRHHNVFGVGQYKK